VAKTNPMSYVHVTTFLFMMKLTWLLNATNSRTCGEKCFSVIVFGAIEINSIRPNVFMKLLFTNINGMVLGVGKSSGMQRNATMTNLVNSN